MNATVEERIQEIFDKSYKDKTVVEIETTQAIATRLSEWAKLLGFFVGIPIGLLLLTLGVLGVKQYSDFSNQVANAKSEVTNRLNEAQTEASKLQQAAVKLKADGDALTQKYQELQTQFSSNAALAEQLKTLSAKVDVIGEKLGFTPTSKISSEGKKRLEDAFKKFQDYLKGLGYRALSGSLSIDIREQMLAGTVAYYDPDKRMMVIDSKYATDSSVINREYMHHVLYPSNIPNEPEKDLAPYSAIESGLAWYFPCSFAGNPNPSPASTSWDLTKKRPFSELHPTLASAITDGTEIWGAAFWELRNKLGQAATDKLLYDAWFKTRIEDLKTSGNAGFARKLTELDPAHQAEIRAVFTQRGLSF